MCNIICHGFDTTTVAGLLGFQVYYTFTRTVFLEKGSCGLISKEDTWFNDVKFFKRQEKGNCNTPQNLQCFSGDREIVPIDFNIPLRPARKPGMYCLQQ